MQKSPPPFIWAVPDEKNILECEHFISFLFSVVRYAVCFALYFSHVSLHVLLPSRIYVVAKLYRDTQVC
jgi:hypothetical protein